MIFQLSIEGSTSVRVLFYLRSRVFPKKILLYFFKFDDITKECYIKFWEVIEEHLFTFIQQSFYSKRITCLSKTSCYKINWEKDRDKRFIKNWRPISLLSVDMKLISKVLTRRLKSVISTVVNENQVAYVNKRFISKSGRLISDVLAFTNSLDIEVLLMTVDIEKSFDSNNQSFLACVLKKVRFGNDFRKWI